MQTANKDFTAFKAKMIGATYEKKDDGRADLIDTMKEIGEAVTKFKADHSEQLGEVRSKLELMETKLSRPGAMVGSLGDAAPATEFVDQTGAPMLSIKAGTNVQRAMQQRGIQTADGDALADFARGVAGMKHRSELTKKGLSAGTDSAGGFMLPTEVFSGVLSALVAESTCLQAGAQIVLLEGPDGAKSYSFAALNAIPTAAWRAESGNVAESDPTFRTVVVAPKSLAFFFKVSRELLMDAANMNSVIQLAAAQSFAREIDRTCLLGTGTAPQPRGLLSTAGVNSVSNGANGASLATTRFSNLLSGVQAILDQNAPLPTAAIMSHRTRVGLSGLVATDGQPLQMPSMLQPMRMLSTSQIANNVTVGTSNDTSSMFIGDFSKMIIAMREGVSLQPMNQTFATTGEIGFFAHARVDIAVQYPAAFSIVTGIRP